MRLNLRPKLPTDATAAGLNSRSAATKKATTPGTKGSGGLGGNMDADMNHGADGTAAACWDFGGNAACK